MGQSLQIADTRSLLRNKSLLRLLVAQFLSISDVYGLALAGMVLVEERTQSSAQAGLVLLSALLPAFLGSLFAGAVVDRWGSVPVLTGSYLGRALAALAFWAGARHLASGAVLPVIYAVNISGALFSQFAMASELSFLPDLTDRSRLMSANALVQLNILLGEGFGVGVLTPILVKQVGIPAVGLVGALLSLVATAMIIALPRRRGQPGPESENVSGWAQFGQELRVGWRFIAQDRLVRLVAGQATLAAVLFLVLVSLVPALTARHLGLGVEDAIILLLPGGVGFVLGSILMNRWEGRLTRVGWIGTGLTGLGIGLALLGLLSGKTVQAASPSGLSPAVWLLLPLILALGFMLALVIVPARTVLQERPPPEIRGRVIAAQLALGNASAVVPLLVGGALADRFGLQPIVGILGALALGAGAVGLHQMNRL